MIGKCIILIALHCTIVSTGSEQDNFGTFNLTLKKFSLCNGPKHKDCASSEVALEGYSSIKYNLHVLKVTTLTKGKVVAHKDGVEILRLQMKKPCDHLFFRPLFHSMMNITKDCVISKGNYEFNVDLQKVAQSYWSGSFLFGNWSFKSVFYNDECNFSCAITEVTLSKQ